METELQTIIRMLTEQSKRLDAIEAKIAAPAPLITPPSPPVSSEPWRDWKINDPLAEFEKTPAGWMATRPRPDVVGYPGDAAFATDGWRGIDTATNLVYHAGSDEGVKAARVEAFRLRDLTAEAYNATAWSIANVPWFIAGILMVLRRVPISVPLYGYSGEQSPAAYANIVTLRDLYDKFVAQSMGGTVSGAQ